MAGRRAPWRLILSDEVDSTNRVLAARARWAGAHLVVVADHQRSGRGRRGRTFVDVPGGSLLVSSLHRYEAPARPMLLGASVGGAAASTLRRLGVAQGAWLWPNDVVVGEAKVGGALIEASWQGSSLEFVVGFGLNLAGRPEVPGRQLADLGSLAGRSITRDEALGVWLEELASWLERWSRGDDVLGGARALLAGIGEEVVVERAAGELRGRVVGLSSSGALVLRHDGATFEVSEADLVRLVRSSTGATRADDQGGTHA